MTVKNKRAKTERVYILKEKELKESLFWKWKRFWRTKNHEYIPCRTCLGSCPSSAARAKHFSDEQIFAEIEGILE